MKRFRCPKCKGHYILRTLYRTEQQLLIYNLEGKIQMLSQGDKIEKVYYSCGDCNFTPGRMEDFIVEIEEKKEEYDFLAEIKKAGEEYRESQKKQVGDA